MLLLGGGIEGEEKLLELCSKAKPKSVVGYISDAILRRHVPSLDAYSVPLSEANPKLAPNLYLLAGDGNLELMAPAINDEASRTPFPGLEDPWKWIHEVFLRLRASLEDNKWTIFFDTNPSFSIYTELAICGSTRLLVPVNADDSSRVAVKALFALLHGTTPPHTFFGNYTFAARAKLREMSIPRVHLTIGNRFTQYKGAAAAFAAFSDATADQLFSEFRSNPDRFSDKNLRSPDKMEFLGAYVGATP